MMKQSIQAGLLLFFCLILYVHAVMVPFVIPADINPDSAIAMEYHSLTEQDRLSAKEHFVTDTGQRVRLWGVNLSFNANFPTKKDAERIAARMAAFGVNAVRCHHMDTANWPRGIWDTNGRDLHPEALDRLDYFIDQLAKHGIYTNINLHVGKKHSAVLDIPESNTNYDKMVSIFTPELIAAQKEYARNLLTHKNPYRNNVPYAEDFAVAIVEITNENSLFMWGAENNLRTLPPFYAELIQKQYNLWLKEKYHTQTALRLAWLPRTERLGENLLKNPMLINPASNNNPWHLEQHEDCRAILDIQEHNGKKGLYLEPVNHDGTSWHLQYNQRQLTFQKGQVYTVEFEASAPESRQITVGVGQAHEPWANLGLSQSAILEPEWKAYRMNFVATDNDTNGRLNFSFGNDDKPFYLANVKLCSGVEYTLNKGESLDDGTIELFGQTESRQRKTDRVIFLAETEKVYFDGMRNFIKNDLNCGAMVTGTIVFGPLGLYAQSDMDFIDSHAYWQHPRFPNRTWDPADWFIEQKAMSGFPQEGTLYRLAAERLHGKPFTVTEYNHPAPLDSQAECVPMIASFAAAQDWDGVWLYTYSHSNDNWGREYLNSYFDIDTNPAKWGFIPAGAVTFRDAALKPFRQKFISQLQYENWNLMDSLADSQISTDMNIRSNSELLKKTAFYNTFQPKSEKPNIILNDINVEQANLTWDVVNSQGLYIMQDDRVCVVTGQTARFSEIVRPVKLQIDSPGFAVVTVTSLDGKSIDSSSKILITACGRCENTGMQFSEDRRTVGRNWGTAPVRIEPVEGILTFPENNTGFICKIPNPNGTVKQQIDLSDATIPLKADYGTMWYLVERKIAE